MTLSETAQPTVVEYGPNKRAQRGPSKAFRAMASPLGSLVPVVVILTLWQIGSMLGLIDRTFFPPPLDCFAALVNLLVEGDLLVNIWITVQRVLSGFALGVIPAVIVGITMGLLPWARVVIDPVISILYPIPAVALLPLLLVIFGTGSTPIVVLAGIISFFPTAVNSMAGVLQNDKRLSQMGRNMGASQRQLLWKIILPGALPSIFAGIRLSAGLALLGVIAGEFLAGSDGIGSLTWQYWQVYQITNMYATLAVIAAMGFTLTTVTLRIQRRYFNWTEGTS
ncbi:ABC transporter permease [Microbacterium sp. SLBN-146]|uniref:ABC transporter permease n=1 Tax=Microbacterium sp. SLBN-146 TaxID=2768457 RepID=UPI00114FA9D8|nr:ABC transporter permease [Microbacterium sp. SLBN-146]TQJ30738.1 NitT/TauT family transport system permease protein [Microbacterium sp. SLBN-146]